MTWISKTHTHTGVKHFSGGLRVRDTWSHIICLTSDFLVCSSPAFRDDPGSYSNRHRGPVPAVLALHPVSKIYVCMYMCVREPRERVVFIIMCYKMLSLITHLCFYVVINWLFLTFTLITIDYRCILCYIHYYSHWKEDFDFSILQ